jgi:hypothetical protein
MLGSFAVVPGGVRQMLRCLFVVFGGFLRHMIFSVSFRPHDNASGTSKLFKIAHRRSDHPPLTRVLKLIAAMPEGELQVRRVDQRLHPSAVLVTSTRCSLMSCL